MNKEIYYRAEYQKYTKKSKQNTIKALQNKPQCKE